MGRYHEQISYHPLPVVRRNLVPFLRYYLEQFPGDNHGLLTTLWQDGDEVVRTRMRELLMRLEEISPDDFASRIQNFKEEGCSLDPLWESFAHRRPERYTLWRAWFDGEGEQPTLPEPRPVLHSDMDDDGTLPSLEDAHSLLDQDSDL